MYYKCLIVASFFISLSSSAQHFKRYLRCQVKSSLFKVELENGNLSEWRSLGDMDSAVRSDIIFDFNKMRIIWDVRAKKNGSSIEDNEEVYDIEQLSEDSTYYDYGFTTLKIKAKNAKKEELNYELVGITVDDCGHLYLIENGKKFKSKDDLIVE
jgi:hypothetical protein